MTPIEHGNCWAPGPVERKLSSRIYFRVFGVWPGRVAAERLAQFDRNQEAIRTHRDTLDAQAFGAIPRLDRDDVDNALYNATINGTE